MSLSLLHLFFNRNNLIVNYICNMILLQKDFKIIRLILMININSMLYNLYIHWYILFNMSLYLIDMTMINISLFINLYIHRYILSIIVVHVVNVLNFHRNLFIRSQRINFRLDKIIIIQFNIKDLYVFLTRYVTILIFILSDRLNIII